MLDRTVREPVHELGEVLDDRGIRAAARVGDAERDRRGLDGRGRLGQEVDRLHDLLRDLHPLVEVRREVRVHDRNGLALDVHHDHAVRHARCEREHVGPDREDRQTREPERLLVPRRALGLASDPDVGLLPGVTVDLDGRRSGDRLDPSAEEPGEQVVRRQHRLERIARMPRVREHVLDVHQEDLGVGELVELSESRRTPATFAAPYHGVVVVITASGNVRARYRPGSISDCPSGIGGASTVSLPRRSGGDGLGRPRGPVSGRLLRPGAGDRQQRHHGQHRDEQALHLVLPPTQHLHGCRGRRNRVGIPSLHSRTEYAHPCR